MTTEICTLFSSFFSHNKYTYCAVRGHVIHYQDSNVIFWPGPAPSNKKRGSAAALITTQHLER